MRNIGSVVIHHIDMDGWVSAWVVNKYLSLHSDKEVKFFSYNYGQSYEAIEAFVLEHLDDIDTIYLVDVSLPTGFMAQYAEKICWIDHHKSSIADIADLEARGLKFKHNYSKEFIEDKRVSACELCWQTFFGDVVMPDFVYLSGRYDVWDHRDPRVLELNAFSEMTFHNSDDSPPFLSSDFLKLEEQTYLESVCSCGKEINKWRAAFNAIEARRNVKLKQLDGIPIAIVNAPGLSSIYFQVVQEQHPELQMAVFFHYKFREKNWCLSFRDMDHSLSCLSTMQRVLRSLYGNDIVSMGGHPGSCGATVNDIQPFLRALK